MVCVYFFVLWWVDIRKKSREIMEGREIIIIFAKT